MYGNDTDFLLRAIKFNDPQSLTPDKCPGHCCEASVHREVKLFDRLS